MGLKIIPNAIPNSLRDHQGYSILSSRVHQYISQLEPIINPDKTKWANGGSVNISSPQETAELPTTKMPTKSKAQIQAELALLTEFLYAAAFLTEDYDNEELGDDLDEDLDSDVDKII